MGTLIVGIIGYILCEIIHARRYQIHDEEEEQQSQDFKYIFIHSDSFEKTIVEKTIVEILSKAISKMKLIPKKKLKTVKTFMNFRFISRLLIPMYLTEPIYGYFNNIWANKIFTYSFLVPSTFVLHQQHCHDEIAFC